MEPVTGIHPSIDPVLNPTIDPPAAPAAATATAPRPKFLLRRSRTDRMLSGVCGGLAAALGVEASLVRLGLVALTVLGAGSGALLYLAAWVLVPEQD
jgi:phage shock protein PspC (stress-responsive transcriptional regulator)